MATDEERKEARFKLVFKNGDVDELLVVMGAREDGKPSCVVSGGNPARDYGKYACATFEHTLHNVVDVLRGELKSFHADPAIIAKAREVSEGMSMASPKGGAHRRGVYDFGVVCTPAYDIATGAYFHLKSPESLKRFDEYWTWGKKS